MSFFADRRKRYFVASAAAVAVVVPAGIGLASTNSVATPSASAPTSARAVAKIAKLPSRVLLTSTQLGAGWVTLSPAKAKRLVGSRGGKLDLGMAKSMLAGASISPSECADLLQPPTNNNVTGVAVRGFQKGQSSFGPFAGTAVVRFTSAATAAAALNKANEVAATCENATVSTQYGDLAVTVTPIAVPPVGAQRLGYRVSADVAGFIEVSGQVTAVRKGRTVVMVGQGGLSTNTALTRAMTRKAAAKI